MSTKLRDLMKPLEPEWDNGDGILHARGPDEVKEPLLTVLLGVAAGRGGPPGQATPRGW